MNSNKSGIDGNLAETLMLLDGNDRYINHVEIDRQWKAHSRSDGRTWFYGIFPFGCQSVAVVRTSLPSSARPVGSTGWKEIDMQKMVPDNGIVEGYVMVAPSKPRWVNSFSSDKTYAENYIAERLGDYGDVVGIHAFDAERSFINKPGNEFSVPARWCRFTLKTDVDRAARLMTKGIGGCNAFGLGCVVLSGSTLFSMIDDLASSHP